MRLPAGWGFLLAALVWGAGGLFFDRDGTTRPRGATSKAEPPQIVVRPFAPSEEQGGTLPAISAYDPEIKVRPKSSGGTSVGTAFPVSNDGVWLTARHVVDHCKRIAIYTDPKKRKGFWVKDVTIHAKADIAVIRTNSVRHPKSRPPALAVMPFSEKLRVGQTGFHFGYPMGKPGDVRSSLIRRAKMRKVGGRSFVEPGIAWAVAHQQPRLEKLGGMSGGPVLDRKGRVIGVTVAGNLRRGRILTSAPTTIHQTLAKAGANLDGAPSAGLSQIHLTKRGYPKHGDNLRRQLSVVKVLCSAKGKT
jgi:serine protease Do